MNPQLQETLNYLAALRASWLKDLRLRGTFDSSWRPCLGLAVLVDRFDHHAVSHGSRVFFPNHALSWLAMRDVPMGLCPSIAHIHNHGASMADVTHATLYHGMPRLDFAAHPSHTWNFRWLPDHSILHARTSSYPLRPDILDVRYFGRQWAVLNQMSSKMTHDASRVYASKGIRRNDRGWPAHRWQVRSRPPAEWMPRAYLAFHPKQLQHLGLQRICRNLRQRSNYPLVRLDCLAQQVLVEASMISKHDHLRAVGLWWDITPGEDYLDCELESFIFPPLPVISPARLRWPLPGDVELIATLPEQWLGLDQPTSINR